MEGFKGGAWAEKDINKKRHKISNGMGAYRQYSHNFSGMFLTPNSLKKQQPRKKKGLESVKAEMSDSG